MPDLPFGFLTAAASLYELGRSQACVDVATLGLEADAEHTGCMHFPALGLAQLKRPDEALGVVKAFLAAEPNSHLAHTAAGWVSWFLGHDAKAEEHLRAAIRLLPLAEWAHEGLGLVLLRQGRRDEAAEHFREALRLCPDLRRAREALQSLA